MLKKPTRRLSLKIETLTKISAGDWHRTTHRCHESMWSYCHTCDYSGCPTWCGDGCTVCCNGGEQTNELQSCVQACC